jgi:hypothetical protein
LLKLLFTLFFRSRRIAGIYYRTHV